MRNITQLQDIFYSSWSPSVILMQSKNRPGLSRNRIVRCEHVVHLAFLNLTGLQEIIKKKSLLYRKKGWNTLFRRGLKSLQLRL